MKSLKRANKNRYSASESTSRPSNGISTGKRTERLSKALNDFFKKRSHQSITCEQLSLRDFIDLKKACSDINNIVTLKVTLEFVSFLKDVNLIDAKQKSAIEEKIENTSPNSNGFDVEFYDKTKKIVAEVKCNIPVKSSRFGAAQKKGIYKDIINLWNGKTKSKLTCKELKEYYKFLVLLKSDSISEAIKHILPEVNDVGKGKEHPSKAFLSQMNGKPVAELKDINVTLLDKNAQTSFNTDTIYVVIIDVE